MFLLFALSSTLFSFSVSEINIYNEELEYLSGFCALRVL